MTMNGVLPPNWTTMEARWIRRFSPPALHWSVIALSACAGCGKSNSRHVEIIVSGDTAGWITPCGCASNQSGGLSRRATLVAGLGPADQVLYLDAGGSASGASEYQRIKLEAILRGLSMMNLAAHNIGGPESELEPAQLLRSPKRRASPGCRQICNRSPVTFAQNDLAPFNAMEFESR